MLEGKLAVVTGASRGIGYHCALALAEQGVHVVAVARTVGGLEELDDEIQAQGGSATLVPLDLMELDAIDRLGASVHERWGKLDILVASAGMLGGLSPVGHIDPNHFEKVMKLNVTANFRLIYSLSPLLNVSNHGRGVFLTDVDVVKNTKPFWSAYASSQAALQKLVQTFAEESNSSKMRINMLNPGSMRTALRASAMPGEDDDALAHPNEIKPSLLELITPELEENGLIFDHASKSFLR